MNIVKLQRFSTHDGNGIRTVVFTKGCPLRCEWCHNPETQKTDKQIMFQKNLCVGCGDCAYVCNERAHIFDADGVHIFNAELCKPCGKCAEVCTVKAIEYVGKEKTAKEILSEVMRDEAFFGTDGGITLSGGEPMLQPEESIELLYLAKAAGITTAVESCGYFDEKYIPALCEVTDTFLWDLKDTDSERHRRYTGVGNQKITANLFKVDEYAKNIVLRCIIVNGVNTDTRHYEKIAGIFHKLKHCEKVELIPYHAFAGSKAEQLGGPDNGRVEWIPDKSVMDDVLGYLRSRDVCVTV